MEEICATKGLSVEDRKVFNAFKKFVRLNEGHYELPLPWRDKSLVLPNNQIMALKRLKEREPELKERYTEQMEVMIRKS